MNKWGIIIEIIGIVVATIMSIIALVVSIRNDRKLASKENDLAEGLKSDILELLAIFSSIQYKRKIEPHIPNKISIEEEVVALKKNRLTSGYIYLSHFIPEKEKMMYEIRVQLLINNPMAVRLAGNLAIQQIKILYGLCNKAKLGNEIPKIIEKMYNDEFLKEVNPKMPNEFEKFVYDLIEKGITDPDVQLFHGVFENNSDIVQKALDNGADVKCTDKMIIERYRNEYDSFINKKK